MSMTEQELYWDPFDVDIDTDPYAIWRRLRDDAPLYRNDRFDFWALSRFDDVQSAHRQPLRFSSSHGTVLELMHDSPVNPTKMMIFEDPPEHTELRALVSRAFTPRRVGALEGHIRALCVSLLDEQVGRDSFDFVQDFAARLPASVIATLLGVPPADQRQVRDAIDRVFHLEPGVGMVNDVSLGAMIELHGYLTGYMRDRTANPRDDMLSDLVRAEISTADGGVRRLTIDESANFANLLISAGTETVARLLGWACVVLDQHPDQRAELAADPGLIPQAIEELLRFESPSPVQGRWLTEDTELHGRVVAAGSKVLLLTGAANRDDRAFVDGDRFDIHRRFDTHLAFGFGVHFCLGAALARMEARIALEEVFRRYPTWDVDHARARRLHTSTVRGWVEVPIGVTLRS